MQTIMINVILGKLCANYVQIVCRMGSFTNKPKLAAEENPDLEIDFLPATIELLLDRQTSKNAY